MSLKLPTPLEVRRQIEKVGISVHPTENRRVANDVDKILEVFFEEFDKMSFTIRDPPSKGQRELQGLIDLVRALRYNIQKNEGTKDA